MSTGNTVLEHAARRSRRRKPALLFALLAVASIECAFAEARSPVGVWWRLLPNAAGPGPLQVFELRPDGTFVTHGPEYLQDRGRYQLKPGSIQVASDLNSKLQGEMKYALQGTDRRLLTLGPPLNQRQEWTRIRWRPNFELATVGGQSIPENIHDLVLYSVWEARKTWRPDALPSRVELRSMKNREMEITLDLYSPSQGNGLRLLITRYEARPVAYQAPAGGSAVFPKNFLDLPKVVRIAQSMGHDGLVARARLTVSAEGPTWGLRFAGGGSGSAGVALNAVSGKRVVHDMKAVMADYNRQWDDAIAGIRRLVQASEARPQAQDSDCPRFNPMCKYDEFVCQSQGSVWQYGACYRF